jgi:hypothetical protein
MNFAMGFFRRLFGRGEESASAVDHEREKALRAGRPPLEKPLPAFAFPIETCHGSQAIGRLAHLREQGRREGFTALLLGDADDLASLAELPQFNQATAEESIRDAAGVDVKAWMGHKRGENLALDAEWYVPPLGDWPAKGDRNDAILAAVDMSRSRPKPQVFIARLPAKNSWEVFAHLRYGDWNECPKPHEHVAIARSWHERFGAEAVAITRDTVEFEVSRPPRNRDEAAALAWEHYWYCHDIVDQGVETINKLAASLLVSKHWFFWWD